MNCYECGGTYQEKTDLLEIIDPIVGSISFEGILYYQCDKCDELLYTEDMSIAIEEARNDLIRELLYELPIGDFISAAETASILGISRQALHKNNRINHGFIHHTTFGGVTVYLRLSVLQFKKTGDGRFPLNIYGYNPSSRYVEDTIPLQLGAVYYPNPKMTKSRRSLFQNSYSSVEEYSYAN